MTTDKKYKWFLPAIESLKMSGMPKESINKEIHFAIAILTKNPKLKKCDPDSIIRSVSQLGDINLSLNPILNQCYIITRYNKITQKDEASLMPSYRGMVKTAVENSNLKDVICNVVFEKDTFLIDLASNINPIKHNPSTGNRGVKIGAYAIGINEDGTQKAEWMPFSEIEKIRAASDSYQAYLNPKLDWVKTCVWVEWEDEMSRKSVLKRFLKYVPSVTNSEIINKVIELDNQEYGASINQLQYIESLIESEYLSSELHSVVKSGLNSGLSLLDATTLIEMIKSDIESNTPMNGARDGLNMNQGDIETPGTLMAAVHHAVENPKT